MNEDRKLQLEANTYHQVSNTSDFMDIPLALYNRGPREFVSLLSLVNADLYWVAELAGLPSSRS